ncbi:hypothetical protein P691DRAFT_216794 [Macrolepiota fuliginosa MF-IS2]|uniref:F-box domain-containing protein n=1 Tax=Macrolepiota fuliginosa MF-IS2 TaxID=1400762 RepID=A0A9P5X7D2_9AGAR|nr:hypothetical protein P691DRAFT_216794 [Macrolepiota fuliginosa MF-IS2]
MVEYEKESWFRYYAISRIRLVCQSWNNLCLGDSLLWSRIVIHMSYEWHAPPISLVLKWIQRSRQVPLTIRLVCPNPAGLGNADPYLSGLFTALTPHIARWRTLFIEASPPFLEKYLPLSLADAYELEAIEFQFRGLRNDTVCRQAIALAESARSLRSLKWAEQQQIAPSARTAFLGSSLLHCLDTLQLHLDVSVSFKWLLDVVQCCTSATHMDLEFNGLFEGSKSVINHRRFNLPHLRTLSIFSFRGDYRLLDFIDLPRITSLELRATRPLWHGHPRVEPIFNFLAKSHPFLKVLHIRSKHVPIQLVLRLFETPRIFEIPDLDIAFMMSSTEGENNLASRVRLLGGGRRRLFFVKHVITRTSALSEIGINVEIGWMDKCTKGTHAITRNGMYYLDSSAEN